MADLWLAEGVDFFVGADPIQKDSSCGGGELGPAGEPDKRVFRSRGNSTEHILVMNNYVLMPFEFRSILSYYMSSAAAHCNYIALGWGCNRSGRAT
jgi:hypothetical protein